MSDDKRDDQTEPHVSRIARNLKMTPVEIGALAFAVVWVLICIVFFFGLGGAEPGTDRTGVGFVIVVASVLVPIAVVWLAVSAARSARIMTDESDRLQASMALMRKTLIEVQEFQALSGPHRPTAPQLAEAPPQPQLETDAEPAMFASSRRHGEAATAGGAPERPGPDPKMRDISPKATAAPETAPKAAPAATQPEPGGDEAKAEPQSGTQSGTQPSFKLDPVDSEPSAVSTDDLIRAVNFPENAEDEAGFSALRRALVDRRVATLIQAAQDVLTLLSQDGIYMDDLTPQPTEPELWRRFASGARGAEVAALAGVNDRSSLALSAGRMKSDAIFRDAALHFLRHFDEVLAAFLPGMGEAEIRRFATTRTARAFMLIGQVTGTFD